MVFLCGFLLGTILNFFTVAYFLRESFVDDIKSADSLEDLKKKYKI